MKKIISLILALVLVLGLAVSASAATYVGDVLFENLPDDTTGKDWESSNNSTNTVHIEITQDDIDPVYYVDVKWDALTFEYSFGTDPQWNPESHTYEGGTTKGWQNNTAYVTVTNHSNRNVVLSASIDNTTKNGVTAAYSWVDNKTELETADAVARLNDNTKADFSKLKIVVTGDATSAAAFDIGVVTVTISPKI